MELNEAEKKQIIEFSKKYGLNGHELISNFKNGKWSNPVQNFPLNSTGSMTADTALRFTKDGQGKLQLDFSPKQKIDKRPIYDLSNKLDPKNPKFTLQDSGKDVVVTVGKTQLSGTLLDDKGKLKLAVNGFYGPKIKQEEIDKHFNKSEKIEMKDKTRLTEEQVKQGLTKPQNKELKVSPTMDPILQTQLLLNNLAIMIRLGLKPPEFRNSEKQEMVKELEKKQNTPMLKLTEQEKAEIKAYLNGEKQSHTVNIGAVVEQNEQAKGNNVQTVSLTAQEVNNIKSYVGQVETQTQQGQFNQKYVDAYIVSLREMMNKNVKLPQPMSPEFKQKILETLDSKSTYQVHQRYNPETSKQVAKDLKSSHKQAVELPKKRTKQQAITK